MPDHFREPAKTMGPRSPGSDHSHPLSLVVKNVDESNSLVHKKKVAESKLVSARSPQRPIKSISNGSDTTSGFSSDASGENRICPVSISIPIKLQSCNNETEHPQDFSVERFIEASTSNIKKGTYHETNQTIDDNHPIPLVVDSKISNNEDEIHDRSIGSSKNSSGYNSPNDDSGHDGGVEDNLDTSGSSSPVTYSARYLKNEQSVKTNDSVKKAPKTFRERKEVVIPQVILERKINDSISNQRKSISAEEYTNERNKILPNVTIQKVVSKETDIHNEECTNIPGYKQESLKIQEDHKQHSKTAGLKVKEFARFDTDVVDAAEMERQLIGPNTRYEQTLAALTGVSKRHISPPRRTSKCESWIKGDISMAEGIARDNLKKSIILNSSKSSEEGYKLVDDDVDIRSEGSSVDTWNSSASYHSSINTGENITGGINDQMDQGVSAHPCTYCDKILYNSYHLASHLVTHTGERSFACAKCGKSFGRRSTLRAHMTTHSKTSNFMCPVCEKACNDNNSLEEHIRMHTGEKPFICTVCNKAYARKSHLSVHYRVHTGERPFVCVDCGKDFTEKRFLNDHMQTSHSGVAGGNDSGPLKCPNCYREFAYKTSLKQHLKKQMCVRNLTRAGGSVCFQAAHAKQFSCPFCDKSYSWKQTLKQHVSMYHRNKVHTDEFWKYEMAKHRRTVVDDKDRNDDMWQQQLGRYGKDVYDMPSSNEHAYGQEHTQFNKGDPSHDERWLQQIQRATASDSQKESHVPNEMKLLALQSLQSSLNCIYKNRTDNSEEDNQRLSRQQNFALHHIDHKNIKKECDNQILSYSSSNSPNDQNYHYHKENRLQQSSNKLPQEDNYLSLLAHISAERKASEEEKQEVEDRDRRNQQYQKGAKVQLEKNGSLHGREKLENDFQRSQRSMSASSQQQQHHHNWSPSPPKEVSQDQRSLSMSPPTLALPDIKEESSVARTQMWLAQLGQYRQKSVQEEMEKNHDELWEQQISRAKLNPVKSPIEPLEITIDDECNTVHYDQTKKMAIYSNKGYDATKIGTDESSMSTENSSSVSTISREMINYNLCKRRIMTPLISALQVQQQTPNQRAFKMISEYNPTTRNTDTTPQHQKLFGKLPSTPPSTAATSDAMPNNKSSSSTSPALSLNKVAPTPLSVSPISANHPSSQIQQQVSFNNLLNINSCTIVNVNGQNVKMGNSAYLDKKAEEGNRSRQSMSPKSCNGRISMLIPMESNNNGPQRPPIPEAQSIREISVPPVRHIPLAIPPLQPRSHLAPIAKHKQQKPIDIHERNKDKANEINIRTTSKMQGAKPPKYQPPDPSTFGTSSVLKMLLLDPTKRKRPSTPPPSNPIPNKKIAISPTDNIVNLQQKLPEIKKPCESPKNLFNKFSGAPNASDETDILRRRLLGIKDFSTSFRTDPKPSSMLLPKPKYSPPSATITSADVAETESVPQRKSPMAVEEFTKVAAAAATLASFNLPRDPDGLNNKECSSNLKIIKKKGLPLEINDAPQYQQDISKSVQKPHKQQLLSTQEHLDPLPFEEDLRASVRDTSMIDVTLHCSCNNGQKYCNHELVKKGYRISDKNLLPETKRDKLIINNEEKILSKDTNSTAASSTPSYAKTSVLKHLLYRYTTNSANNNNNTLMAHEGEIFNLTNHTNNNNSNAIN